MDKKENYDDLYLESLQYELELLTQSKTDVNELKLLKKRIKLMSNLYRTNNTTKELIARRNYVINNKKYSLIEISGLSLEILVDSIKCLMLEDDLHQVEIKIEEKRKIR